MQDRTFDFVLSVGSWCGIAQNLRRYFRVSTAYPFDWWLFSWQALVLLLDEDFSAILQEENLFIDPVSGYVNCRHYGIAHVHDFALDGNGKVIPDFAPQLPFLREKFRALIARMDLSFAGRRVLAVRYTLQHEEEVLPADATASRATALLERLQRRWPTAEVHLLVVNPTPHPLPELEPPDERIRFEWPEDIAGDNEWKSAAWDKVFQRQQLAARRAVLTFSG